MTANLKMIPAAHNRNPIPVLPLLLISVTLLLLKPLPARAQLPSTEIYLSDISRDQDGDYRFSTPVNITNREGYDNQPAFLSSGKLLYTVQEDSSGTEIYVYDPVTARHRKLTDTPESEYSPTPIPGSRSFSVVRVDGDSVQRLYQVSADGNNSKHILKLQDSIGYHCWLNENRLALFILGEPSILRLAEAGSDREETVAWNIGRCLARVPGTEQVSYVDKTNEKEWYIKVWNPETKKAALLVKTPEGTEDYAWTPDKKILMFREGKLMMSDPYHGQNWKEVADFSNTGLNFYRLAVNETGTRVALVAYRGKKP